MNYSGASGFEEIKDMKVPEGRVNPERTISLFSGRGGKFHVLLHKTEQNSGPRFVLVLLEGVLVSSA